MGNGGTKGDLRRGNIRKGGKGGKVLGGGGEGGPVSVGSHPQKKKSRGGNRKERNARSPK